jgi:hypothetical protein
VQVGRRRIAGERMQYQPAGGRHEDVIQRNRR